MHIPFLIPLFHSLFVSPIMIIVIISTFFASIQYLCLQLRIRIEVLLALFTLHLCLPVFSFTSTRRLKTTPKKNIFIVYKRKISSFLYDESQLSALKMSTSNTHSHYENFSSHVYRRLITLIISGTFFLFLGCQSSNAVNIDFNDLSRLKRGLREIRLVICTFIHTHTSLYTLIHIYTYSYIFIHAVF